MEKKAQKRTGLFNMKDQTQIKTKILLLIITSLVVVVLLSTSVAIGMSYKTTLTTIDTFMTESAAIAADNVRTTVESKLVTVSEFASRAYFIQESKTKEDILLYCDEFTKRHNYLMTVYIDKDGMAIDGNDASERAYFQEAKATLKPVISDPLLSKGLGTTVVVLAAPIVKNGAFDGLILTQANADFLSGLTSDVTIGKTGKSYMIDGVGNTIAHYDENMVLESYNTIEAAKTDKKMVSIASIQKKMLNGDADASIYSYAGVQKILGYAPVGINNWSIGIAGNTSEFLSGLYTAIAFIGFLAIISIPIVIVISSRQIKKIVLPLQLCSERIVLLGEGNLNAEFPIIDTKDEIGVMADAAKKMITTLGDMINDVDYLLNEMANGNFDISSKAQSSYQGDFSGILTSINSLNSKLSTTLIQIDETSKQVALGSSQMAESAQALAEGATDQAGAVEELMATIANVATLAETSAEKTYTAYSQAIGYEQQAELSSTEMKELTKAMERINQTSNEIENIIAEIEDIASQTNLLSLNASIEAARAGEAGRGFAVVADQIGKLAADSAKSAVNTRVLIGKSINEINNGNNITLRTSETLEKVIHGIKQIAQSSKETSDASTSQAQTMKEIEQGIDQISSVVQNNSAAAQETSATSEELSAQSENLKELVGQFQLKK